MRLMALCLALAGIPSSGVYANETIIYTYDAQGRLTQAVHSGTVNNGVTSTYAFDNADNRTNLTVINGSSRVVVVPLNGFTVIPISDP